MALLKNAKGRKSGSGYARVFSDPDLGHLISRVHSTVISYGSELERIIKEKVELIDDLDRFLEQEIMPDGVLVADKQKVKRCETLDFAGSEPDFLIFRRKNNQQACHLVELKDGDTFDTKKAAAEHRAMHEFISKNAPHLQYKIRAHFCCFNQDSRQAIFVGFKRKIPQNQAMTGREFCNLLELNYEEIVKVRAKQGAENVRYFLKELVGIGAIRGRLKRLLKN